MPTYTLRITETEKYVVKDIEAETKSEAFDKALEIMESDGRDVYHDDSDGGYEVLDEQ